MKTLAETLHEVEWLVDKVQDNVNISIEAQTNIVNVLNDCRLWLNIANNECPVLWERDH